MATQQILRTLKVCIATFLLVVSSSCNDSKKSYSHNEMNELSFTTYYEDDTIRITAKRFYPKEDFSPGLTEVWKVNKIYNDSVLCVKSNPHCYGRPMDSIPSINNVWYRPYDSKMIVEGVTCDAGHIATYIIDLNNGEQILLPTNCGFVGFTNWNDYFIASEKVNDIDYDLVLWYENVYIFDWDGNVISRSSTKDGVIEAALPQIHHETGWHINDIKLTKHTWLTPKYKDDHFYGSQYEVSYSNLSEDSIKQLMDLCKLHDNWTKRGNEYHYKYDDYDNSEKYGMFVTMCINPKKKTGIIQKGAYSNPKNSPKL